MVFASLILGSVLAQEGLAGVSQLQANRDFDAELMSVPVFLKTLSKEAGVELYNGTTLNEFKVDVFVKQQPLHKTLSQLADVLDAEWVKDQVGYRLSRPNDKNSEEQKYIEAEDQLAMQKLDFRIAVARRIAQIVPPSNEPRFGMDDIHQNRAKAFQEWLPQFEVADKQLKAAKERKASSSEIFNLQVERDALYAVSTATADLITSRLISQLSDSDIRQLKSGQPFAISNQDSARFKFSVGDDPMNLTFTGSNDKPMEKRILALMRVDPYSLDFSTRIFSYAKNSSGLSGGVGRDLPFNEIPSDLSGLPFAKSLGLWDQSKALPSDLDKPLNDGNLPEELSKWWVKGFRLGEHLRWFHRASGVPVVAISDRVMTKTYSLRASHKNQKKHLESLIKSVGGFARFDDGFLKVRNGVYWRHRRLEIPESAFLPIESAAKQRELTLNDFANFSVLLSLPQARRLVNAETLVKSFNGRPLSGIVGLKLYGSLASQQRSRAATPVGVPYSELNGTQKQLFLSALVSGIFDSGSITETFLNSIVQSGLSEKELSKMSLRMTKSGQGSYSYGQIGGYGNQPMILPTESFRYENAPVLQLGYDGQNCVNFGFESLGITKRM